MKRGRGTTRSVVEGARDVRAPTSPNAAVKAYRAMSKRSAFITLFHALTKSFANFALAPSWP